MGELPIHSKTLDADLYSETCLSGKKVRKGKKLVGKVNLRFEPVEEYISLVQESQIRDKNV